MYSPTKLLDQQLLLEIGELIQALQKHIGKMGVVDIMERYGDRYQELQTKVETYNYTKDDEIALRADSRLK